MAKNNNGLTSIIKENAPTIIMVLAGWLVGFALLQARVKALEITVAEYPSQDFFTLKFENIDDKFDALKDTIKGVDK